MIANKRSPTAPFTEKLINAQMYLTRSWVDFIRLVVDCLKYVGSEDQFELVNNQSGAADITPLKFDYSYTSAVFIEYVIQRVTSSTNAIQAGVKVVVYNPDSGAWTIAEYGTSTPAAAGITFSITSTGQVQYTSSNLAGTQEISRICFRKREIAAKSSIYSKVG